ncbi:MAG: hypothetical protein Q9177_004412 [Variospora cf. flavescens]
MVEYIDLIVSDDSVGPDTKPSSIMDNQANKAAPVAEPPAKKVKLTNSDPKISQSVKQQNPSGKNAIIAREEVDDFSSSLTSEMVNIYVGPKRKPYHIHRNRICSAAPFFSSHFGPLEDTKTPVTDLYLPNHDPRAFGMFLNFVYGAPIPSLTLTTTAPTHQPTKTTTTAATATAAAAVDQQHATNTDTFIHLYLMARTWSIQRHPRRPPTVCGGARHQLLPPRADRGHLRRRDHPKRRCNKFLLLLLPFEALPRRPFHLQRHEEIRQRHGPEVACAESHRHRAGEVRARCPGCHGRGEEEVVVSAGETGLGGRDVRVS